MIATEREREAETQAEGEASRLLAPGARRGIRSRVSRDRIPHQAPGAWSLLLPLPMSLGLSLSVPLWLS